MFRGIVFRWLKANRYEGLLRKRIYARIQKQGKSKDVVYKLKLIMKIEDFR